MIQSWTANHQHVYSQPSLFGLDDGFMPAVLQKMSNLYSACGMIIGPSDYPLSQEDEQYRRDRMQFSNKICSGNVFEGITIMCTKHGYFLDHDNRDPSLGLTTDNSYLRAHFDEGNGRRDGYNFLFCASRLSDTNTCQSKPTLRRDCVTTFMRKSIGDYLIKKNGWLPLSTYQPAPTNVPRHLCIYDLTAKIGNRLHH